MRLSSLLEEAERMLMRPGRGAEGLGVPGIHMSGTIKGSHAADYHLADSRLRARAPERSQLLEKQLEHVRRSHPRAS